MLTLAAGANAEDVAFSNPPGVAAPAGYSHVAVVPAGHRTIYVAGQLGFLPDGTMAGEPGDFSAQAEQAFRNVSEALRSAGSSWDQVVKINMYVTDARSQLPLLRQVRDRFVNTDSPPTSTTVQIASLVVPGALFEIDAVAVQP
ncbi:MAG: RidA family protein [Pseudomonas sp.]